MKKFDNEDVNKLLSEIKQFKKTIDSYKKKINVLNEAIDILDKYQVSREGVSNLVKVLNESIDMVNEGISIDESRFDKIRQNCEHYWIEDCWDSHHTYYLCKKCGQCHRY